MNKEQNKTNTGYYSTGDYSTGDYSTGDYSTGNFSTGNRSTGDCSTGNRSTGDCSTGYCSTGDYSTGYRSTGDYSTGDYSTGCRSTGHYSTSHYSTGYCSTGNYSVGHFCTKDYAPYGWFNIPSKVRWHEIETPHFTEFYLTRWVTERDMSEQEKKDNPSFKTTGGYLKTYTYKEAWANFWRDTDEANRQRFLKLPHFDAEIFKEITGIDVEEKDCSGKVVEIDGVEYRLERVR